MREPPDARRSEHDASMRVETALPPPRRVGPHSLEEVIQRRRSRREFENVGLSEQEIGQLLWAAQGISSPSGYRTAPSAGALYPLELYLITPAGISRYQPDGHRLHHHLDGDRRQPLADAALQQAMIAAAPATILMAAVFARLVVKYGEGRSPRYAYLEAGHAAQNVLLQAEALGLGSVAVGAFVDERVRDVLHLPKDHAPLYLLPIGRVS